MSQEEMPDADEELTEAEAWAYIFNTLGKSELEEMLLKVSLKARKAERVVVEFREGKAMDITEHVEELEGDLRGGS